MKFSFQKMISDLKNAFRRKNIFIEPVNLFEVHILTSHHTTYLVKYSKNGQFVIDESMVGTWKKKIQVPITELLKFQVYITNPTENKKLKCQIEVNELSEENTVINTTKFSFPIGCTLETWEWKTFEVKSILN